MESERDAKQPGFTGSSLDSPGSTRLDLGQNTESTDAVLAQETSAATDTASEEPEVAASETGDEASVSTQQGISDLAENKAIVESDVLEIFAEDGSWIEVRDASGARLFYNMVPKGDTKVIQGKAPFHISLGNAKTTRVLINDLEIDMAKYIRPNNTVNFTVSTAEQKVIIH
jgi:cytoskeleton protein RodZ